MALSKLPLTLISQTEVTHLIRELAGLEDNAIAATVSAKNVPSITKLLAEVAVANGLDINDKTNRQTLKAQLTELQKSAPLIHISFASEPSQLVLEKIIAWLRTNIHAQLLLQVGLEPGIAAGCILRTPNHVFDMSLRPYLEKQKSYLQRLIQGAIGG